MPFDWQKLLELAPLALAKPGSPQAAAMMQGWLQAQERMKRDQRLNRVDAGQEELRQAQMQNLTQHNQRADETAALARINDFYQLAPKLATQAEATATDPVQANLGLAKQLTGAAETLGVDPSQGMAFVPNMTQVVSGRKKKQAADLYAQAEKRYAPKDDKGNVTDPSWENSITLQTEQFGDVKPAALRQMFEPAAKGPQGQPAAPATRPSAASALGSLPDYLGRWAKERGKDPTTLTTTEIDAAAKEHTNATQRAPMLQGMNALYAQTDAGSIAQGIREGTMPPDISQYGRPVQGAIASELRKPGPNGEPVFDLASAQRTWKAQLRLNSTMNGNQQVRLDESVRSGLAMYDRIDEIASRWDAKGLGPLSRARLELARQGASGPEAQSMANELTGQIAQLTSDVATIEQGGLTPTNESRAIAEKSMQDWWGKGTIHRMTAQGRANMRIRELARVQQPTFVGGNANPYTPPPPMQAPYNIPGAGTVRMRAPDGRPLNVPPEKVPEMEALGAKRE